MPDRLILASAAPGEIRVALLEDGVLAEYALWRPGSPDGMGDIHLGRVTSCLPALAGAFVAISGSEGFLPDSAGARGATEGQMLPVRITRTAQGGKGPRLAVVSDPDASWRAGAVRLLTRGADPLRALAKRHPEAVIAADDPALIPSLRADLGCRVNLVKQAFPPPLEEAVGALSEPTTQAGGALIHIEPTRALTAIDIDAGSLTTGRLAKGAAQAALNRALLPELARQIRLRNLGGAIVIDLAGMPARRRAALAPALEAALRADPLQPRLLGFTALGLAEVSRPRLRPPLHELLATPLAAGLAALRATAAQPGRALCLRAAPAVIAALEADANGLADLARRGTYALILRSDPSLSHHAWVIEEMS